MSGLQKQAKVLTATQAKMVLRHLETTRHDLRNKVIFLLSLRAGLRACEIAALEWNMLEDASGALSDVISLQNKASKGKSGGMIPLNKELRAALEDYRKQQKERYVRVHPDAAASNQVIRNGSGEGMTSQVIQNLFSGWYRACSLNGCSSHSGRRTAITQWARKISSVGGSIKDVQMLARHSSLSMTQKYIETNVEAIRKVVQLV